jgi:hypothetical protein
MKRKLVSAVLTALAFAACSGIASAHLCKDVTIKVDNDFTHDGSPAQIQVVDFDYWDDGEGKWREENWVGNVVIDYNAGARTIATRNLEYVGGESGVIIRVHYKYMTEKNGWSERLTAQSTPFTCSRDGPNSKTIIVGPM